MRVKVFFEKLRKNKELRDYVIWGVVSSVVNILLFKAFLLIEIEYRVSNVITLIFVRVFCYLTNKFFVFHTKRESTVSLLKEIASFFLARAFTFFVDYFGLIVLVEIAGLDKFFSKIAVVIIVVIINYILNKTFVFAKPQGRNK